jgi:hypothetical protein
LLRTTDPKQGKPFFFGKKKQKTFADRRVREAEGESP